MLIQSIIFYLLLIDSISANLLVWFGSDWYAKHLGLVTRLFPPAKGWALYYLLLVLWIGWLIYRQGGLLWLQ